MSEHVITIDVPDVAIEIAELHVVCGGTRLVLTPGGTGRWTIRARGSVYGDASNLGQAEERARAAAVALEAARLLVGEADKYQTAARKAAGGQL